MQTRRRLLAGAAAALGAVALVRAGRPATAAGTFPMTLSEAEWRRRLSAGQYAVLRQSATERPFSSPLLTEHRAGIFTCAGCERDLFSSAAKFDSRTGWPSFWAAIDHAVGTERDTSYGMVRTSVHCAHCGGHLGHLFDDGPRPTGLRYCMNGVALGFRPTTA